MIGLIVVLLIAFADGILLGHYLGNQERRRAVVEKTKLGEELKAIQVAHAKLQEKAVILESSSQLDRLALVNAQKALADLHEELSEVKQEVDLYRRIGSAEEPDETLAIKDFQIIHDGGVQYRLTLSQGVAQESEIKGIVQISFKGRIQGEKRTLTLKDVDKEHASGLHFGFQYYQLLSGTILWPDGFVPESVEVRVVSAVPGEGNVLKRWAWDEVAKG